MEKSLTNPCARCGNQVSTLSVREEGLVCAECVCLLDRSQPVIFGYARCSTDEQNLDLQVDALQQAGCETIFQDEGASGTSTRRSGLEKCLAELREGDTLIVWKLDRLGRSLSFLISFMETCEKRGIGFRSITDGINTSTAGGKLVFHIMGALAEFERDLISERTRAGLKAARKRGKHLGRPPALSAGQISHAREMIDSERETISSMAELLKVDRGTLRRALSSSAST